MLSIPLSAFFFHMSIAQRFLGDFVILDNDGEGLVNLPYFHFFYIQSAQFATLSLKNGLYTRYFLPYNSAIIMILLERIFLCFG